MATCFESLVGADDEKKGWGSVTFAVWVDGKKEHETSVMQSGDRPQLISVDLTGAKRLALIVGDCGGGDKDDLADWAEAGITIAPDASETPETLAFANGETRLKILPDDSKPAIDGTPIVGPTPGGHYCSIAATGTAPLYHAA